MSQREAFFEVDLDKVETPQLPDGGRSPKGYSRGEIDRIVLQLSQVQRLGMERGYTYEDFARLRSSADPGERALGETHHKFYDHADEGRATNNDYLRLSWDGRRYRIQNGNHRIGSAKRQGLRTVPSHVCAAPEHMERCQLEGQRSALLSPSDRDRTSAPARSPVASPQVDTPTIWDASPPGRRQRDERGFR